MTYFQCSIQKEKSKREEKLYRKKLQTQTHRWARRGCTLAPTYMFFLFVRLLPTPQRLSKIDALYLYSSYMYSHIWRLFNSIKGTLVTLYTNIVEASLFHSSDDEKALRYQSLFLLCHSAKCAIPTSRSFTGLYVKDMKHIQVKTELELCLHRTQKYTFFTRLQALEPKRRALGRGGWAEWMNMSYTESVHTRRNIAKIIIQLLILPAIP